VRVRLTALLAVGALALAPSSAWALPDHEIGQPSGERARGVVQVVPGGGWQGVSPDQLERARDAAERFRARGFVTLTHRYGRGFRGRGISI
jgi:hypothetical protein